MTTQQFWSLVGLMISLVLLGLSQLFGRHVARRHRMLDERYELVLVKAKVLSWQITFAAIILLQVVQVFVPEITLLTGLTILYLVHILGRVLGEVWFHVMT